MLSFTCMRLDLCGPPRKTSFTQANVRSSLGFFLNYPFSINNFPPPHNAPPAHGRVSGSPSLFLFAEVLTCLRRIWNDFFFLRSQIGPPFHCSRGPFFRLSLAIFPATRSFSDASPLRIVLLPPAKRLFLSGSIGFFHGPLFPLIAWIAPWRFQLTFRRIAPSTPYRLDLLNQVRAFSFSPLFQIPYHAESPAVSECKLVLLEISPRRY